MKTNEDKCHLIVSTNQLTEIQIRKFSIKNSSNEKFVGVNIDSKLNFDCHVNYLCNKVNNKLRKKIATNSFLMQSITLSLYAIKIFWHYQLKCLK